MGVGANAQDKDKERRGDGRQWPQEMVNLARANG